MRAASPARKAQNGAFMWRTNMAVLKLVFEHKSGGWVAPETVSFQDAGRLFDQALPFRSRPLALGRTAGWERRALLDGLGTFRCIAYLPWIIGEYWMAGDARTFHFRPTGQFTRRRQRTLTANWLERRISAFSAAIDVIRCASDADLRVDAGGRRAPPAAQSRRSMTFRRLC